MTTSKLRTAGLDLHYGDFQALIKVDIAVPERRITALIGPSGCGKSTLLRVFNRMNDTIPGCKVTGRVTLDAGDIYGPKVDVDDLRKRVGMVFATPQPLPGSIRHNLTYGPRLAGVSGRTALADRVEASLRAAQLWDEVKDRLDRSAFALSGGQQQRLCIARALALEPEVILLDEPCSGLDPISTLKIEQTMESLRDRITWVIVTNNTKQAARVSQRTAFFLLGELIEDGPTEQLFTAPHDHRTGDYIEGRFG